MTIYKTYTPISNGDPVDLSGQFPDTSPLIFLLRHGRIQGHKLKRFIGRTDVAMDQKGMEQAQYWKAALSGIRFDSIYSSSLKRCKETARIIRPKDNIHIDSRLNEINMGSWDGKSFEDIRQNMPDEFEKRGRQMGRFRPPGGESFIDLQNRVLPFFYDLKKKQYHRTLVVTHAGVIRVTLCRIMGLAPEDLFKINLEYSQLSVVSNIA